MPSYRVSDTLTGEVVNIVEATDFDAWMSYRMKMRLRAGTGEPMPFDGRAVVTDTPGGHRYAVEEIDAESGAVRAGTYITV
jgi:hypothetical protein